MPYLVAGTGVEPNKAAVMISLLNDLISSHFVEHLKEKYYKQNIRLIPYLIVDIKRIKGHLLLIDSYNPKTF